MIEGNGLGGVSLGVHWVFDAIVVKTNVRLGIGALEAGDTAVGFGSLVACPGIVFLAHLVLIVS
jgi:hypothetical protein